MSLHYSFEIKQLNMKSIITKITLVYYGIYTSTILLAVLIFLTKVNYPVLDPKSTLGITLTQITILFMLISIPLALGGFYRMTKKWRLIEDQSLKLKEYQKGSIIRLIIIGIGLLGSIFLFYLSRDLSLIYCAAIAALSLIFCKPSEGKLISDLKLDETEEE